MKLPDIFYSDSDICSYSINKLTPSKLTKFSISSSSALDLSHLLNYSKLTKSGLFDNISTKYSTLSEE